MFNFWLPVLVWAIVIFSFSASPTSSTSEVHWQDFVVKKSAHIFEYAVFSFLLYRALRGSGVSAKKSVYYSFLIAVLYGLTDEFHQSFTPGREPKLRDVFFDSFGALTNSVFVSRVLPKGNAKIQLLAQKLNIDSQG